MRIDILLPTYNGAHYLDDLLTSLYAQSYQNFSLYIRDDHSTDETLSIINEWQKKQDNIQLITDSTRVGVVQSLSILLSHSKADYIMFCDQDDVWMEDKIEESLLRILELEKQHTSQTPILIHTDLKVVDSELKIMHPSFIKYSSLTPRKEHLFNRLLTQNCVTGCTVLFNKALKELSCPLSEKCLMHDWWIALNASAFGILDYLDKPTILYRQHGKNTLGAIKAASWKQFSRLIKKIPELKMRRKKLACQAKAFLDFHQDQLQEENKRSLEAFLEMAENSFFKRKYLTFKHHFHKQGVLRQIGAFFVD